MRAFTILALCCASLSACGSGDSSSFADRFDAAAVAADSLQVDAPPENATEAPGLQKTQESAPDRIAIIDGPVEPPRRAVLDDFTRQRLAARRFLQGVTSTEIAREQDVLALGSAFDGQTAGTARYEGLYRAEVYKGTDRPGGVTVERAGSDFAMTVDFATGAVAGGSTDGRLVVARAPRRIDATGFDGQVTFDAIPGRFEGQLSDIAADANFAGETPAAGYIGAFESRRAD